MEHSPSVMDRRRFLRNATVAALGLTAAGSASLTSAQPADAAGPTGKRAVPRGNISVQLWSLRSLLTDATAIEMVFETLFDIGYRKVEPFSNHGLGWDGLREILDRTGLTATSMHNGDRNPTRAAEAAATLGATYANMNFARFDTLDGWRDFTDVLNAVGAAMADVGVRYGYHNHDAEFQVEEDGVQAYDVLLTECDPKLVHMQLDLYWAVAGGADPVEVFTRDPGRFLQFHVKDMDESGFFADPGEGIIDFPRIFAARKDSGVIEYIAENDAPADPIEFAETAFDYLRTTRF